MIEFKPYRKLSPSILGVDCKRKLVLLSLGRSTPVAEKLQRIFDVGTKLESVVVDWLVKDGWDVWYPASDRNVDFELQIGNGYLRGKIDFLKIMNDDVGRLYDVKVVNLNNFEKLEQHDGGLLFHYLIQGNLYVWALQQLDINQLTKGKCIAIDKKKWGLVVMSREKCEYKVLEFEYDESLIQNQLDTMEEVFQVNDIDSFLEIDEREQSKCKWCPFESICLETEFLRKEGK